VKTESEPDPCSQPRLLLVTYYYPPLGGSGVFRPLRLSKYLPATGWDVTVLTVSEKTRVLKDPSLIADVPAGMRVERTGSVEPRLAMIAFNRMGLRSWVRRIEPWFMVPDDQLGWVGPATRRACRVLTDRRHDAVLTTAGPYSAHLVGRRIQQRFGLPWVADFRDEWTTNPYLLDRYPTAWHRRLNRRLEREVVQRADRVVCVSRPWLDSIHRCAPAEPPGKFVVLPNGYDADHFPDVAPRRPDRFRIVHTGTFYGHRSPVAFLEALRRVVVEGSIPTDDLEVVLMGHGATTAGLPAQLERTIAPHLRLVGHRPYREALALIGEAAVLLLVIPREGGAGNHTGKLFPYLASGRPILALAPEPNVAAELIRDSRSGIVTAPDDPAAIRVALERLYADWKDGTTPVQRREVVERYEGSRQARDWSAMFDELVQDRQQATRDQIERVD
jgi:glycosyltransferase involved in cell wall biosynthesis